VDVVLLTLDDGPGCAHPRVPVLACRDALTASGAGVSLVTARSDLEIDAALDLPSRLVVGAASDAQLRAVLRRLVRRYAPRPADRPGTLPPDRTVPDLPAIGVLGMGATLVASLDLPGTPEEVAKAVLAGQVRRLDLLRNDAGSVTLHGTLLGGESAFAARVDVDDAVLSDGREQLTAVVVSNAARYASADDVPLTPQADATDGRLDDAVALPVTVRDRWGRRRARIEVRRAHGRAVAVAPQDGVPFTDDGVAGTLSSKRTWWMERSAWAAYVTSG